MKRSNVKELRKLAARIRLETLKVIHSRGFGHVGGSMDLADLMAVLYGEVMHFDPKNPRDPDRDWLVLSKGHAGPVAYATFGLMGFYPMEDAYTLNQPHTRFPSHTDRKLTPGVDLTTGSLGQGASTAAGAALGNRIDGRRNRVFCVIGDGEADEGQVWEAFHFAYAHKLDNLIYFIDNNGYQLDGRTADILDHGDIAKKAAGFGLYTMCRPFTMLSKTPALRRACPAASCWIPSRARAPRLPSPSGSTPPSPAKRRGRKPSPPHSRRWRHWTKEVRK